jgi:hypothetical protein
MIPNLGSINIDGQIFVTLTTIRRGGNSVYGNYRATGYLSETGVLSGTVNLTLGTFNITATSEKWDKIYIDSPPKIVKSEMHNTTFDDTTASAERTYYYWVKASNSHGMSNFSSYDAGSR